MNATPLPLARVTRRTNRAAGRGPKDIFRRRVQHVETLAGGIESYAIKSLTREGVTHTPHIDPISREVDCSCEQFRYRLARHHPTLDKPDCWCKHIARAVAALERRMEREGAVKFCHLCGVVPDGHERFFPLCDDNGEPVAGLVCAHCIAHLKENYEIEPEYQSPAAASLRDVELQNAADPTLEREHGPIFASLAEAAQYRAECAARDIERA